MTRSTTWSMVVGGARLTGTGLGWVLAAVVAEAGCGFCGGAAGCWAAADMVSVAASNANIIQFVVRVAFRMTLISKVFSTPVETSRVRPPSNRLAAHFVWQA